MMPTILITGGTGFLGKHLALALKQRHTVILTGRNNKQNILAQECTGCKTLPMDVTNIESLRDVFNEVQPRIVIHAAATKFVDLSERQPMECVDVNVLGSQNIARVSVEHQVETVLGISTDKAAPPVGNTYGLSKALMERMFCRLNGKTQTKFACVRFGNLAWSTGSVLPIWKKMHETSGVIRTTGPEMTRFFFTVDEAVALVKTVLEHVDELQGKVLTRWMKAARIKDVLAVWIKYRGGGWEKAEDRPGEMPDHYLIGESELSYTSETAFQGITHYVISFNEKPPQAIKTSLSTLNTEQLSEQEILDIINHPPADEML